MKQTFDVTGMTCSACSANVERAVKKLNGIGEVNVNLLANRMVTEYDESLLNDSAIIAAVTAAGYGAAVHGQKTVAASSATEATASAAEEELASMRRRLILSLIFFLPLFYISMGHMMGLPIPQFMQGHSGALAFAFTQFLLTLPVMYINRKFFQVGFKTLLHGAPNMDSLIAIGSSAAVVYGVFAIYRIGHGFGIGDMELVARYHMDLYFESAATILTLITVGKFLETRSKGKTGEAIAKLLDLAPKTAIVVRGGVELEIPVADVVKGDIVVVRPGQSIAVDGVIVEGSSAVDQSALTGESIPVEKTVGDKVIAATIEKKVLLAGDTLDLFATAVQQYGQLTEGKLEIPELGIVKWFKPDDGLWNASIESFHVKVPMPANVKLGPATATLKIRGLGGKITEFKIPFRIRGAYRTTSVMQNFDNGLDAVDWYPVANGDNATSIEAKVFNGAPPHGGFIRHDFIIEQPPAQGWPNFAGAYYVIPEAVKNSVGIVFDYATNHNNPDGYFEVQIASEQVKDYDEFMVRLKNTRGSWVRDTLIWENMAQEGWGKTIPQLDPKQIKNFAFRARYSGKGYISLDNIYLLQENGTEVPMPKGLRRLR